MGLKQGRLINFHLNIFHSKYQVQQLQHHYNKRTYIIGCKISFIQLEFSLASDFIKSFVQITNIFLFIRKSGVGFLLSANSAVLLAVYIVALVVGPMCFSVDCHVSTLRVAQLHGGRVSSHHEDLTASVRGG